MAYIPDLAIQKSGEISGAAFRLFCYYCKRRNTDGVCWPDLKTVARELDFAYSYASEMRKILIEKAWISFDGTLTTPLLGFGKTEIVSENPNNNSEKPKLPSTKNSEKPKEVSEKPNNSFGKTELHVRKNQPNEPTQLTRRKEKQTKAISAAPEIAEIFDYWKIVMGSPRSALDSKRVKIIQAALDLGYGSADLKTAIAGCGKSDWHLGRHPNNSTKYNGIDLILRDAEKIDKFIAMNTEQKQNGTTQTQPSRPLSKQQQAINDYADWLGIDPAANAARGSDFGDGSEITNSGRVAALVLEAGTNGPPF